MRAVTTLPACSCHVMLHELQRQLSEASAQVAMLCAEHGIVAPDGVMSLHRLRGLEDVLDMVERVARGERTFAELRDRALAVGRQP